MSIHTCERNLDAQLFLRACGLRCDAIQRNHYHDGSDGYRFSLRRVASVLAKGRV